MLTKATLVTKLKNLGLKPNDTVMVHASLRSVGKVLGGPDEIHQAIMQAISPAGTMMMYVGCEPEYYEATEENNIYENCPTFCPATARARRLYGAFAEFFRSWPGVICSDNPGARMAALGAKANGLVAEHPLNYGYGPGSPLAKLYETHGKILLLGSDLDQVTILHYAEHIAPIDKKRIVHFKVPLLRKGQRTWVDIEEYDTDAGIRKWPDRFFASIVEKYIQKFGLQSKKVGQADSYIIDVVSLVDFAIPIFVKAADKYPC